MIPDLEHLLELYRLDVRLRHLKAESEHLPREIARLREAGRREDNHLAHLQGDLESLRQARVHAEEALQNEKQALEQSNARLGGVSNNREYDAAHAEIGVHRHRIEQLQRELKTLEARIGGLDPEVQGEMRHHDEVAAGRAPGLEKLLAELETLDSRKARLEEEKAAVRARLSSRPAMAYDRLVTRKGSTDVIGIVLPDRKNCSICQRVLPSQELLQVSRNDGLRFCQSCGSILIHSEKAEEILP